VDKAHQLKISLHEQPKMISLCKNNTQLGLNGASSIVKQQQRKEKLSGAAK